MQRDVKEEHQLSGCSGLQDAAGPSSGGDNRAPDSSSPDLLSSADVLEVASNHRERFFRGGRQQLPLGSRAHSGSAVHVGADGSFM